MLNLKNIKTKYQLNENANKQLSDYVQASKEKKVWNFEKVWDISEMVKSLNKKAWANMFSYENGYLTLDINKLPKGTNIALSNNLDFKTQENKVLIGGKLDSFVWSFDVVAPGKTARIIALGKDSVDSDYFDNWALSGKYI